MTFDIQYRFSDYFDTRIYQTYLVFRGRTVQDFTNESNEFATSNRIMETPWYFFWLNFHFSTLCDTALISENKYPYMHFVL